MTKTTTTTDNTAFDAFFLAETSRIEIDLPNGEPMLYDGKQVAVNVYGPATGVFAKAKDAMDKEASKRVFRSMGAKMKKGDEEDKDADAKFLTAITDSIENFPFPGGAGAVYREQRLKYVADQVRGHLNDLGNFFTAPTKN